MWLNLIDDETLSNTEFIYNLSYGKDSMAGLHVTIDILGIPVSRIVHAEVWATDTIPADLPPMVEFKRWADGYIKGRWGLTVEHVCATRGGWKRTFCDTFHERNERGKHIGELRGFPMQRGSWCKDRLKWAALGEIDLREAVLPHPKTEEPRQSESGGGTQVGLINREAGATSSRNEQRRGFPTYWTPWCNSDLKRAAIRLSDQQPQRRKLVHPAQNQSFSKSPRQRGAKRNIVHLLGIAADEPERVARYIDRPGYVLPLVEANWHEDLCGLWCQYEGMLSPVYENACRSGCWFCHNQSIEQLRLLRKNYPDLWALLLKWDLDSPVTFKADGHTVHDFDERFRLEDEMLIDPEKPFFWKMLNEDLQKRLF